MTISARTKVPRWLIAPPLLLLLVTGLVVFASPAYRVYDEAHYFTNTSRILSHGIGLSFFREMLGPTGPLHNFTQVLFAWFAGVSPTALRLHNLILVVVTLVLAGLRHGAQPGDAGRAVLLGFAMPGVWVLSMMGLTEAPSSLFLMLSLVLLSIGFAQTERSSVWLHLGSGLSLSVAATGRQTLVALSGILLGLKVFRPIAISWRDCLSFAAVATVMPALLFAVCGGVQPPDYHVDDYRSIGIFSLPHLLIGLGYAALYVILLAPSVFQVLTRWRPLAICGIASVGLVLALDMRMVPMRGALERLAIPYDLVGVVFPAIIVAAGLFLALIGTQRVLGDAGAFEVTLWIALAGLIITVGAVPHQFSSRYIAQGFPIIVLLALYLREPRSLLDKLVPVVGMVLGLASIMTYYGGD